MGVLNRAAIFARPRTLKTEVVNVPEWGGDVIIQELSAGEAAALGASIAKEDKDAMVRWVIACAHDGVIDDQGQVVSVGDPLFTDGDRETINGMAAGPVIAIGGKAIKLSGFGAPEAAKN